LYLSGAPLGYGSVTVQPYRARNVSDIIPYKLLGALALAHWYILQGKLAIRAARRKYKLFYAI
jgi:hypothetical protein